MSRMLIITAIPLLVAFALCGPPRDAAEPAAQPSGPPAAENLEQQLARALKQRVTLDVVSQPLERVVAELGKKVGLRFEVDRRALKDANIGVDLPVTQHLTDMPLASVLRHTLDEFELTFTIRDEALLVTTADEANAKLVTHVYPVPELVEPTLRADGRDAVKENLETLEGVITSVVASTTWDDVGGPGSMEHFGTSLVISQTPEVFDQIESLLTFLRRSRELWMKWDGKTRVPELIGRQALVTEDCPDNARISKALQEKTEWKIDGPLSELAGELAKKHQINIVLNRRELSRLGFEPRTPVTDQSAGGTLDAELQRLLAPLGLTAVIRDDALVVTAIESLDEKLVVRAYPVFDLAEESFGARPIFSGGSIPVVGDLGLVPPSIVTAPPPPLMQIGPWSGGGLRHPAVDNVLLSTADELIALITGTIAPTTWEDVGGPGAVEYDENARALLVSTTEEIHAQTESLLAKLRLVTPIPRKMSQERLDEYDGQVITIVYLLAPNPGPPAAAAAPAPAATPAPAAAAFMPPVVQMPTAQELAGLIRTSIAPEIWKSPQHSILPVRGRLRIVAPRKTQRAIDQALRELNVLDPFHGLVGMGGMGMGSGGFGL